MNDKLTRSLTDELDGVRRDAVDTLKKDIEKTVADAREVLAQAATALARAGQSLAEKADAESRAFAGRAREQTESLADDLERHVRDNPVAALGAALGVGVLVGLLVGGGRR